MRDADRPGEHGAAVPDLVGARVLRRIAWGAGTLAIGVVALVATLALLDLLVRLVTGFPAPYGRLGIAFVVGYVLGGAGLLVAAWRVAHRAATRAWLLPLAVVVVAIAVRAAVAVVVDAPLSGENLIIHEQALGVLDGASCCFGHRPMAYPLTLAGAYAMLGVGPGAIELLNIGLAAVTTWLVWDIGRLAWDRRVGAVAATTFAILPSQVLMSLVPLTEPMYTAAVAAAVRLAIGTPSRRVLAAATVGLAIAAGQYVRATAASLLAPITVLPFLVGTGLRRSLQLAAVTLLAFVVAMLPVVSYNLQVHDDLSVSTSAYAGWSLFVGANQEHDGRWNATDAALFARLPGASAWEMSEHAGALGVERILDDPGGYLELLPRKFGILWADETYAAAYALTSGSVVTREVHVAWLLSQLFYVPILVLALVGMIAERRDPRPVVLLIGMIVFVVAATHLFLEVHSRYHAYLMPLLGILAAGGAAALVRRYRARGDSPS